MTDSQATLAGFLLSALLMFGYPLWLAIKIRKARNVVRAVSNDAPAPRAAVATELKPNSNVKVS